MTSRPYTPRVYQELATRHLLSVQRGALWAGMGMGKTVSALTALDAQLFCGEITHPTLAVAPTRVAKNVWPYEVKKWDHLKHLDVVPILGSERERLAALKRDVPIFTINYDNLPWLVKTIGHRWPFRQVIPDEATRLKGFRTRQGGARARALATMLHPIKKIDQWWNLTGTPAPNGLADLWGQTWYLDGGARLGRNFTAFEQRWFRKSFDGYSLEPFPFAREQIENALRDICLSLRAEDYFDIQKPMVTRVNVELPPHARKLYRSMERELFLSIGETEIEAFNAASRTMKCLQLAAGGIYESAEDQRGKWVPVHDAKLAALESIVEEAAGEPILVSYQWKSDLTRILKAFPQARELDDKKQTEDDWNAGKIPILVAHPKSAGHGLNLQDGGHILVYFSDWWDFELHDQILERIGPVRQMQAGHNKLVRVYHIVAENTIDELVLLRHSLKRGVQNLLMEAMRKG
jgi:SNF2 family DNA or RNA helicase